MTTTPKTAARFAAGSIAALAVAGTLAGCATAAETDGGSGAGETTTDGATAAGSYTDGSYTASGTYQSPGGSETIEVTLTLADGVVTDVTVTGDPSTPDATRYQGEFESGIADEIVGQSIDDLNVDRVGGSSLTSGGFNDALEEIKAEAAA
jgi:uncharacterized protein with FMN-binding domain